MEMYQSIQARIKKENPSLFLGCGQGCRLVPSRPSTLDTAIGSVMQFQFQIICRHADSLLFYAMNWVAGD
jgi:hypothetical protein